MPTSVQLQSRANTPGALWEAVLRARRVLADQRLDPPGPFVTEAREGLLDALEEYAESLVAAGRPIPYLLRDELRIQQRTVRRSIGKGAL
jgi:hypothetical protein